VKPSASVLLERLLLYLVAFSLFVLPLFIWPGITEYGYGKTILAIVLVSILSVLWCALGIARGTWRVRIPWLTVPVVLFILASLLSLIHAVNGRVVIQSLVLVVTFFVFVLLVIQVARTKRDVQILLFALLASGVLAGLYGLLQYLGVMRGATVGTGPNQVISTLGNRNYLGGFLSYLLFPSVVLLVRSKSRVLRILTIALIAFCFGTTLLMEQSGANLSMLMGAAAFLIGWLIFRPVAPLRRNRIWLLALLGVLVFTYLVEAPSGPLNSVVGLSAEEGTWLTRTWHQNGGRTRELDWWVGWEMFKDHPLTGIGLGNYKLNFLPYRASFLSTPNGEPYRDLMLPRAAQAHNEYIQGAAEVGILGVLSIVGFLGVGVTTLGLRLVRSRDEADRFDLLLLSAGVVGFLVHALFSFPAHLPASCLALVLLIGLVHAPTYGPSGMFQFKLTGRWVKGLLIIVALVGIAVSTIALRDLVANTYMNQGIEHLRLGDDASAEQALQRSAKLDFAPRQTWYWLATAQARQGKFAESLESLEKCFTRFVDEVVYLLYAELATNYGDRTAAREAIELILSAPSSTDMHNKARYLQASITIQDRDYIEATRLLEDLAADAPDFERAQVALGNLYVARGMPVNAKAWFDRALTLIDRKLADIDAKLAGRTTFTTLEYGQFQQSRAVLRQERDLVLAELRKLGNL